MGDRVKRKFLLKKHDQVYTLCPVGTWKTWNSSVTLLSQTCSKLRCAIMLFSRNFHKNQLDENIIISVEHLIQYLLKHPHLL